MNKKKYVKRLNQLRVKHQLENERKRISRDLHDNIGAYVTSLISKIDKLKNTPKDHFSEGSCADVRLDAENILALLRQTIWVLGNKETNITVSYTHLDVYKRQPNTQQSTNLVPLIVMDKDNTWNLKPGKLGDVAPSILKVMGVEIPEIMTGDVLVS